MKLLYCKSSTRKVIHSIKVGIALVLVSLLYLLNPLFEQVGENAMWAIMTVVVIFEFYPGATLCKGINRGIGTLLGGGLGCLIIAVFADEIGEIGKPIIVACSVFVFGGGATYCRQVAKLKRCHDYGLMIFILTFNLVAVSGVRANKVVGVAAQRLETIGMGFAVCIFISLLVCPMWASDEFHYSTASNFTKLATNIQGCLDEYFKTANEKGNKGAGDCAAYIQDCKSILNSKSNDDSLANYAKWEPWHGKFGFNYPWDKYLEIGQHLRELAVTVVSLQRCLQSPKQPAAIRRQSVKEACEIYMVSIVEILRELGESIEKMEKCEAKVLINPKLQSLKKLLDLTPLCSSSADKNEVFNENVFVVATFSSFLLEIVEKVEVLGEKVELLGDSANFKPREIYV